MFSNFDLVQFTMKRFQLLLLLIFSIFLLPENTVACGSTADNTAGKEISHLMKEQFKSCCNHENNSENHDNGCSSKCEQTCCSCAVTSSSSAFNLVSEAVFKANYTHFFTSKETNFSYISKAVSNGFLSIWLIPKIG